MTSSCAGPTRAAVPTERAAAAPRDRRIAPLLTPDGRYIVVRGRLWRAANPALVAEERTRLTALLMTARRAVAAAQRAQDAERLRAARATVQEAKVALGERGPVWWTDGAPDYNRHLVRNTPYAEWYAASSRRRPPPTSRT